MDQEPTSPTPAPVEPISPQPTLSPRSFNPFLILVVIVLLVVVGTGGVFLGKYLSGSKSPATVQPIISSIPTQAPMPTIDPTAGWKIYTNIKYGLEVKYPPSFTLTGDLKAPSDMDNIHFESLTVVARDIEQGAATSSIQIAVFDNPKKLTLEDWVQDKNNISKYTIIGVNAIGEPTGITVNGYNGVKILGRNGDFPNNVVIFLENGGKIYAFTLSPINQAIEETTVAFDQILSTFKFLD